MVRTIRVAAMLGAVRAGPRRRAVAAAPPMLAVAARWPRPPAGDGVPYPCRCGEVA